MSILSRASFRILKLLSTFPRMKQDCLQKKLGVKVCAFLMLRIIGSQAGVMVEGKLMVCKIKCWWARGHVKTAVKEQSEEMKGCDGRVDGEWRAPLWSSAYREASLAYRTVPFFSHTSFAFRNEHLFSILTVTSHAFITPLSKILLRP